ncbi:DUF4238 domain-containing protein [Bacillus swezeyi]|uniref:DUF4238 domain-containing protein n=1 Tax=Bacillus swezeyi TaxID=1925020 RepID=UPI0011E9484D|nr:DUF4238 domain-containing protein [Bacillus swezeyi]TYS38082.1 DUF4238 domain-containing protein [Bacillus swezeyi]
MSKNVVKNQHYVSEFILKNFANEKQQVFECILSDKKVYLTNTNRSMSSKNTYEHDKLEQNTLENYFSKIESRVAPSIQKIIAILEDPEVDIREAFKIIEKHLSELLIFYYRSGALLHEYTAQYDPVTNEDKIEVLIKKIIDSKYLENLKSTIINNYEWTIIKSKNNDFLLSDQYLSTAALSPKARFLNITNRHMGLKDVIILIPLSSKYYFTFYNGKKPDYIKKESICYLNFDQTTEVNIAILNNSYNKCISPVENMLSSILPEYNRTMPLGAIAKYSSSGYSQIKLKKEVFYYKEDKEAFDFFTSFRFMRYKTLKRNQMCICESGLKYKKCCLKYVVIAERMTNDIRNNVNPLIYFANPNNIIEQSIDEVFNYEEPKLLKDLRKAKMRNGK